MMYVVDGATTGATLSRYNKCHVKEPAVDRLGIQGLHSRLHTAIHQTQI